MLCGAIARLRERKSFGFSALGEKIGMVPFSGGWKAQQYRTVPFIHTATITRKAVISSEEPAAGSEKSSEKSSEKILGLLKADPKLAARAIADALGISTRAVEKQIAKLREEGRIRRIGPDKGGHWEVVK